MTDLAPAIRAAILGNTEITSRLSTWQGSPAVFTRMPIPEDASFPCVIVQYNLSVTNQDALREQRTVFQRNVAVYGNIAAPGEASDQTRAVEIVANELRRLFHRNKDALGNTDYHVIDIVANGPVAAPVDDNKTIGRMVALTLRIQDDS